MIPGMRIVQAPIGYSNQYTVEVDVRWGNIGYEYGLIFGQGNNADSLTYRFGVDPSNRRYRLRYGNDNSGWECVDQSSIPNSGPSCWINFDPPNLVHRGTASNHLKIECDKSTFSLYINDNPHPIQQINNHSCRGRVGVFAQSITHLNAAAYFDNFKVSCSSSGMNPLDFQGNTFPVSTTFAESDYDR